MKVIPLILWTAAAGMAAPAAAPPPPASPAPLNTWESGKFSIVPRSFQKNPRIDVLIVTEYTALGRQAPPATAEHPVYYTGSDGGLVSVGDIIAGERPPPSSDLARLLVKSLDKSGFLPATADHPATLFIHYRWGSFNKLSPIDGSSESETPPDDTELANLIERAALVGGTRFAVDMVRAMNAGTMNFFENRSARTQFLVQEAYDNRYFLIATAYDYEAAKQGKVAILWRTKLSTNSQGISMDESLPQMVVSAASYFGHETDGPVRLNRTVVKEGHVELGTATVKEDLPSDARAPVTK